MSLQLKLLLPHKLKVRCNSMGIYGVWYLGLTLTGVSNLLNPDRVSWKFLVFSGFKLVNTKLKLAAKPSLAQYV